MPCFLPAVWCAPPPAPPPLLLPPDGARLLLQQAAAALLDSLAPGGVLLYETFASGNETVGKPSRPDFLLRPGELLEVCCSLRVVAFEDGFVETPARFTQRIAAVRELSSPGAVPRYVLNGSQAEKSMPRAA